MRSGESLVISRTIYATTVEDLFHFGASSMNCVEYLFGHVTGLRHVSRIPCLFRSNFTGVGGSTAVARGATLAQLRRTSYSNLDLRPLLLRRVLKAI